MLVPAIKLTTLPGVFVDEAVHSAEYFHLLLERHEILFSEGLLSERSLIGQEIMKEMDAATIQEIRACFPEHLAANFGGRPARLIPNTKQQKKLIQRHEKNRKPVYAL